MLYPLLIYLLVYEILTFYLHNMFFHLKYILYYIIMHSSLFVSQMSYMADNSLHISVISLLVLSIFAIFVSIISNNPFISAVFISVSMLNHSHLLNNDVGFFLIMSLLIYPYHNLSKVISPDSIKSLSSDLLTCLILIALSHWIHQLLIFLFTLKFLTKIIILFLMFNHF